MSTPRELAAEAAKEFFNRFGQYLSHGILHSAQGLIGR
jgi:hypothetical protein